MARPATSRSRRSTRPSRRTTSPGGGSSAESPSRAVLAPDAGVAAGSAFAELARGGRAIPPAPHQRRPVVQHDGVVAVKPRLQLLHGVAPHDLRADDAEGITHDYA